MFFMLSRCYSYFARQRRQLWIGYGLFVVLSLACLFMVQQRENIESLLPDSADSTIRRDFEWLQKAPFASKVLIDLEATAEVSPEMLKQVATALAASLPTTLFPRTLTGPPLPVSNRLPEAMWQVLPSLVTAQDFEQIRLRLQPQAVQQRLSQLREQLLTPQGWWLKSQLRNDPLALWQISAAHLQQLNPLARQNFQPHDFVSADGRHRLLIAETTIAIGDVNGSRQLIEALNQQLAVHVPASIRVTAISGHYYTLANAETIQRDLRVVLGVATVAILLIFVWMLRSVRALWVFFLPASVLGISAATVALFFPAVSGITIGFGAVLLGITVDFTLHVFFALRGNPRPQQQLQRLSRPLLGSALTSFLAFSVLLLSALPGQRQLAVFSMTAIALALLLALTVMPQLCGHMLHPEPLRQRSTPVVPMWALLVWGALLLGCACGVPNVQFDGDLRNLSVVSAPLRSGEQRLKQVWGDLRGSALLFACGENVEQALATNERAYDFFAAEKPAAPLVSLAPLLPSESRQQQNRHHWQQFWQQQRPALQQQLTQFGGELGFSATAFAPFLASLQQPAPASSVSFWQQQGLATLLDGLIVDGADQSAVISLVDESSLAGSVPQQLLAIPGVRVISQERFRQQLSQALAADFSRFIGTALLVVVLVLALWYRRLSLIALALVPVASGLLFMFGVMGWLGLGLNLFNVIAAILIIGLGVDYGIFMLSRCDGSGCEQSSRAVLVSALTTVAGFGSLTLADHPAMFSIGLTVLLGISAAVLSALLVVPVCYERWLGKGGHYR